MLDRQWISVDVAGWRERESKKKMSVEKQTVALSELKGLHWYGKGECEYSYMSTTVGVVG
jgi:hypothetical protein